jgi:hypothetical protein
MQKLDKMSPVKKMHLREQVLSSHGKGRTFL